MAPDLHGRGRPHDKALRLVLSCGVISVWHGAFKLYKTNIVAIVSGIYKWDLLQHKNQLSQREIGYMVSFVAHKKMPRSLH
jgi:hypothetical protein